MRYSKVREITKFLFAFFRCNVLNVGLLNKKLFRLFLLGVVTVIIAFLSFELFRFFTITNTTFRQTSVIIDTYSCTVFMWTFVVFLFIKILFMKKGTFLGLTEQMPVTGKEKNVALLIFEIGTALGTVFILSSAMIIAVIARDGWTFFTRLVCNILFHCVTVYLIFELLYGLLGLFCNYMGLEKIKNVIVICTLSLMLLGFYLVVIPDVLFSILSTYTENTDTAPILFYTVINEKYGMMASSFLFILIVFVLGFLIIHMPYRDADGGNKYVRIVRFIMRKHGMLGAYMSSFLRKADTISYYFIAVFFYLMAVFTKTDQGYFAILILSFNCLYAYIQTEPLRYIMMQKQYSVLKDYFRLIGSQIMYISLLAVPFGLVHAVIHRNVTFLPGLFVAIVFSVVCFTMVGILFPAKNENPFSAMVGILFILLIGVMVVAVLFLLQLGSGGLVMLLFLLFVTSVLVSLLGMKRMEKFCV